MIELDVKKVELFNNMLLIPIEQELNLEELVAAQEKGKKIHVALSVPKKKRSISANNFCWALCQQIAEAMSKGGPLMTREDVYRKSIKELFEPVYLPIKNVDVPMWSRMWRARGTGWLIEDAGENKVTGYTKMAHWVGSSQFDTVQMSRLIDGLVEDARALGIDVMNEADRALLLEKWEQDREKEGE